MKLYVFSSSRAIRKYYENNLQINALLDHAMSIADFQNKIIFSPYFKASSYDSLLLMKKACDMTRNLEKSLKIPSNFFAFLKNNSYLFAFFKELSLEKKDIKELKTNDAYAQYEEHLEILEELFKNYLKLLEEQRLYDDISLPFDYDINLNFVNNYDEIIFDFQGFLSAFEIDILLKLKEFIPLKLQFTCSKFNKEFLKTLKFLEKFDIKEKHFYVFDLNNEKILLEKNYANNCEISYKSFNLRSLQASYVFEKINDFMQKGVKAKDIVVITPDENFVDILRLYDKNNVLNYASGKSIKNTLFYHRVKALYMSARDDEFVYQKLDIEREEILNLNSCNLHFFSSQIEFDDFKKSFDERISFEYFYDFILKMLDDLDEELKELVFEELIFIKELIKDYDLSFSQILELFFMQIDTIKLSSVGGGEVTVMGLLESRGLSFDGVVIVDFNDDFIPKRVSSELFLNNEIRKKSRLITHLQRENLQRHYYYTLINKAKYVGISYVENEEKIKSRFLKELDSELKEDLKYSILAYANFFNTSDKKCFFDLEQITSIKIKHDIFEKSLSFSRLNLFLKHGLDYYYRYVLGLKEPKILNDKIRANDFGILVHKALECYYSIEKNRNHFDYDSFMEIFLRLDIRRLDALNLTLVKMIFKEFEEIENKHFDQGYRVKALEFLVEKEILLNNQRKITLKGIIDRIDEKDKEMLIIDYKSGKVDEKSYQLAFYKALLQEDLQACYYDLKNSKMIFENAKSKTLQDLLELLNELSNLTLEKEFYNQKPNPYSPYAILYKKEFKL